MTAMFKTRIRASESKLTDSPKTKRSQFKFHPFAEGVKDGMPGLRAVIRISHKARMSDLPGAPIRRFLRFNPSQRLTEIRSCGARRDVGDIAL
jgi:hypothetical protein